MNASWLPVVAGLLFVNVCSADLVYLGDYETRSATITVPIEISGGSNLQSLALAVDASPLTITEVTYTGTIFDGLPLLTFEGVTLPTSRSIFNVAINEQARGVAAEGVAMFLTFDTSRMLLGESATIQLDAEGLSAAADNFSASIPLTFRPGTITAVPEPSGFWLLAAIVGSVVFSQLIVRAFRGHK